MKRNPRLVYVDEKISDTSPRLGAIVQIDFNCMKAFDDNGREVAVFLRNEDHLWAWKSGLSNFVSMLPSPSEEIEKYYQAWLASLIVL